MLDWTVRHGRSAALYVALKSSPDQVLTEDWTKKTIRVIISYLQVSVTGSLSLPLFDQLPTQSSLMSRRDRSGMMSCV